jgi:polysaccharide biosynthesis/export protein
MLIFEREFFVKEELVLINSDSPRRSAIPLGMMMTLLLCLCSLSACHRQYRNVLFNTPVKYQQMGLAVVHLNPDTNATADETYQHRIQPDDLISLRFLNNFDIAEGVMMADGGQNGGINFWVDKEGYVSLPMLGLINIKGHTKKTAQTLLQQRYSQHFKDPNIEVSILNLSVSVQGEVANPGIYELRRERTTLLEMLAAAGGISDGGKQQVVKVIRGTGQDKDPEIFIFDLRQLESITTSDLILRDKDVIYVEPRDIQVVGSRLTPYSGFLSILTTVAALTGIILNFTLK